MNKIKLLALAIVIGTSSLFATEISHDIPPKEVRNQLMDLFPTPSFTIEDDITIDVFYIFTETGHIEVLWVESYNQDIINYVRENMHHKLLNMDDVTNKVFTLPLKLKKTDR